MLNTNVDWSDELWSNPPSLYRSAPFWSWNDKLTEGKLSEQIEQMQQAGMGGFFMHSRYGLKTAYLSPEWFEAVKCCVEKARQLDMKAYLYDEDRWPSGTAGGMVTRGHPEYGVHRLMAVHGSELAAPLEKVASFGVTFEGDRVKAYRHIEEGQHAAPGETLITFAVIPCKSSPWYNEAPYLDVLNPDAVAEFLRVSYQPYADRYSKDFGTLIPGIFTDEPNYFQSMIELPAGTEAFGQHTAWTGELPRLFRKRRGYDLCDRLPEIFFGLTSGQFSRTRHDYYRTLTELYSESYSRQIGQWCQQHNIAYTGHYLCEDTYSEQIPSIGAAMPHYEHQQWPGIDMLCDQISEINTAKQCSSVASQMGHERVLSELYGVTGWDWPLEGHKFNAGWQYVLGVNFRCPHLSWYSMVGGAKRDYPASIFPHSPWWKYYRCVEDYFGRLSLMLTQGKAVRDVLVLSTIESAWGNFVPRGREIREDQSTPPWPEYRAIIQLLCEQHYDYDLGDESLLAKHGKVKAGALTLGKMKYSLVLVPSSMTLRKSTVAMLQKLIDSGGNVVFAGRLPERVDGQQAGPELAAMIEQATRCGADASVVTATLEGLLPRRVSITEDGREAASMWYMLRQIKGLAGSRQSGQLLFIQSIDRQKGHRLHLSVQGRRPVVLWDCMTGNRQRVEARAAGDRVEFDLELPATGAALVSMGLSVREAEGAAKAAAVVSQIARPGPWEVERLEPNVLPLDYCRVKIEEGSPSEFVPVTTAETMIRAHFGLPERDNGGCQPWYLAQTGRWDSSPRGACELAFTFRIDELPPSLQVAIERPGDYQLFLNGQAVSNQPAGSWVDPDIKVLNLLAAAKAGQNELVLKFTYHSDMEIEDLHLLGDFSIRQVDDRRMRDSFAIIKPGRQLAAGSWVGQGLEFYGGSVMYRIQLDRSIWSAISEGRKVRLSLPNVKCTCAAVHVGNKTFVLPWAPMSADITPALMTQDIEQCEYVSVEVIGGRHNSFGPLHVPWLAWTGPGEFSPRHPQWTDQYLLNDHGLLGEPVIELLE